jgi:hypothetical protein
MTTREEKNQAQEGQDEIPLKPEEFERRLLAGLLTGREESVIPSLVAAKEYAPEDITAQTAGSAGNAIKEAQLETLTYLNGMQGKELPADMPDPAPKSAPKRKETEREKLLYGDSLGRFRKQFDEGFEELCALLPASVPKGNLLNGLKVMQDLKKNVLWAGIEKNDEYITLETGTPCGFMVIVPPGNSLLKQHPNLSIKVDQAGDKTFLQLGPFPMSKPWAAIELMYGLSIIYARLQGIEPMNPTREQYLDAKIIAVENEVLAANVISKGRFLQAVPGLMQKLGIRRAQDIQNIGRNRRAGDVMYGVLDETIYPGKPLSPTERNLRGGVYMNAMAVILAQEIANKTGVELVLAYRETLGIIGK